MENVFVLVAPILGFLGGVIGTVITTRSMKGVRRAEEKEIEQRITTAVLERAEEQLRAYREENERLKSENETYLNMIRVIRRLIVKLVEKMKSAGIDPELTDEEHAALYDTGKLAEYAKRRRRK